MKNCLIYKLFFPHNTDRNVASYKRNMYIEFLSLWCIQYQWYKDPFRLWIQSSCVDSFFLYGCVDCGESVEDEWFIVWLLSEISKIDPEVIIQVTDEDGEFLLIECANHLPSWINPENAENRVWFYRGELCIICKAQKLKITLNDALETFRNFNSSAFLMSSNIQTAIQGKMKKYPDFAKTTHLAHVTVPYPVAAVFTVFGSKHLINSSIDVLEDKISDHSAVQSWLKLFKNNLTIFANHCKNKGRVLRSNWPKLTELSNSYVTIPIRFNRLRYALLRHLPTPSGFEQPPNDNLASSRLAAELGLKLCIGLDLLLNYVNKHEQDPNFTPYFMVSGETKEKWNTFVERLTSGDYFKDVSEESWLYNELQQQAQWHFLQFLPDSPPELSVYRSNESAYTTQIHNSLQKDSHFMYCLLNYMENSDYYSSCLAKSYSLKPNELPPADDDSWMFITPEELDKMLLERNEIIEPDPLCSSMSSLLQNFMRSSSSFKGIEPNKQCHGTKRKSESKDILAAVDNTSSSEEITSDENFIEKDFENGYSENCHSTVGETRESMNMGDIMKSLLEANDKILSENKGSIKSTRTHNVKSCHAQALSVNDSSQKKESDILTYNSDDDDDDLAYLYGPRSECSTYFRDYTSSSVDSLKDLDISKDQSKETESKFVIPCRRTALTTNNQYSCSSSDSEKLHHSGRIPSKVKKTFSMKKYLSHLEDELKNEPVNIGRYIPSTHKSSVRNKLSAHKTGSLNPKKPRGNIQIAEPEDIRFSQELIRREFDDSLELFESSSSESIIETSDSELDQYVTRNLCASMKSQSNLSQFQPSGPAANLLSAMGLPIHQISSNSENTGDKNHLNY
ncbi:Protein ecdysoneless like [Schistosoma japonicum]|nr:Protein ecdysoneless like [Schistosoma japonicum]KAH8867687.1 Protein ecdysoneless like [Schistosoma japonicum]KAH8867689.1 Protein ecdysoneless like [Schistosoma japonicum]